MNDLKEMSEAELKALAWWLGRQAFHVQLEIDSRNKPKRGPKKGVKRGPRKPGRPKKTVTE